MTDDMQVSMHLSWGLSRAACTGECLSWSSATLEGVEVDVLQQSLSITALPAAAGCTHDQSLIPPLLKKDATGCLVDGRS